MRRFRLFALAAFFVSTQALSADHPLDPLSADEINAFVAVLSNAGHTTERTRYPHVRLEEPEKAFVLAWKPGQPIPRTAHGVVRQGGDVYEAVVDLTGKRLVSYRKIEGAQSAILLEEWAAAQDIALADPRFAAALRARGIDDLEKVFCGPFSMGYFGIPEDEGKRLVKVGCFDLRSATNNSFGWPIEGLYAVVDLAASKTVSVHDQGPVPISKANLNYGEGDIPALRAPMKPVKIAAPNGGNVIISGHQVEWQKWRLHVSLDRRVGLVLSTVGYDGRSVLYRGYLSEMFVPYMDPDYGWYSRTYFDTGEYGAGMMASSLAVGVDCPETATFLNAVINEDSGAPVEQPNVICVFERNTGDPVWRHAEEASEGRPGVELVVRFIPTVGNYDYIVDAVFNTAGEITFKVGATGVDALKGVKATTRAEAASAEEAAYGTLVAPNLTAVHHDHYYSFRLDLDVDGPENTLIKEAYRKVMLEGPRRSIYRVEPQPITKETGLEMAHEVAKWRVTNPSRTNAVGNPVSYEIVHHAYTELLLDESDWPAKRAAFATKPLWVTGYDPNQRYAAGDYVFGSKGDDGLGVWTESGESVENRDLVLWVTMGMNHLTRSEDLPVLPTVWHQFKLRPFNFHDRNPAIDLRTKFAGE